LRAPLLSFPRFSLSFPRFSCRDFPATIVEVSFHILRLLPAPTLGCLFLLLHNFLLSLFAPRQWRDALVLFLCEITLGCRSLRRTVNLTDWRL